jgi:hypothetical protein
LLIHGFLFSGPAQVIRESAGLETGAQIREEISSRSARRAITVAEDKMHEAPKMGLSRNAETRKR